MVHRFCYFVLFFAVSGGMPPPLGYVTYICVLLVDPSFLYINIIIYHILIGNGIEGHVT